jgi:hypothetical protein
MAAVLLHPDKEACWTHIDDSYWHCVAVNGCLTDLPSTYNSSPTRQKQKQQQRQGTILRCRCQPLSVCTAGVNKLWKCPASSHLDSITDGMACTMEQVPRMLYTAALATQALLTRLTLDVHRSTGRTPGSCALVSADMPYAADPSLAQNSMLRAAQAGGRFSCSLLWLAAAAAVLLLLLVTDVGCWSGGSTSSKLLLLIQCTAMR